MGSFPHDPEQQPHQPLVRIEETALTDRGCYTLLEADGDPEVILIASGSEVGVAVEARTPADGIGRADEAVLDEFEKTA